MQKRPLNDVMRELAYPVFLAAEITPAEVDKVTEAIAIILKGLAPSKESLDVASAALLLPVVKTVPQLLMILHATIAEDEAAMVTELKKLSDSLTNLFNLLKKELQND